MYHYRSTKKVYASYPRPSRCSFCDPAERARALKETEYAFVVPNCTFYDHWETRTVEDHLMVIPKQHVESFLELSDAAKIDIMTLIGEYESTEYNVYARAASNQTRSVAHQHTHLIRTGAKAGRGLLYLKKPYFLVKF
jgi:diadenosine tetraphosphate (Ap4A) HIT family hydrolase